MCGIAGWLNWNNQLDEALFTRMVESLAHRGPNCRQVSAYPQLLLGHARLSIIDLDASANQPMSDHTGRYHLVYNGELYNYKELRSQLANEGAQFRTASDTEVILEAYKRWGDSCIRRFNGMFAFALWDETSQRLWIARDRMGEKPLFYLLTSDGVIFASELHSLLMHPACARTVDYSRLGAYLTLGYDADEHCLIENVRRLPPAHMISFSRSSSAHPTCYWDLSTHFLNKHSFASSAQAESQLNELIDDSVKLRLVSDVPLGAFLSGGIDSSTIVSSMAQAVPRESIQTFTMGFSEQSFDETHYARLMADHLGIRGHFGHFGATPIEIQQALEWAARDPLADTSFIPTYALSLYTRQHVTVALSGDGGDECLAGYDTYTADKIHALARHIPAFLRSTTAKTTHLFPVTFNKVGLGFKARQFANGLTLSPQRAHSGWRNLFSQSELQQLITPDWRERLMTHDPYQSFAPHFEAVKSAHFIDQAMYVDMKTWLANDILVKVDRASMAHGLETRAPFLDHRLVEFCASLPVDYKLQGFTKKAILKRSQQSRMPSAILHRAKRGFNAPFAHWFCDEIKDYAYHHITHSCLSPMINKDSVDMLWSNHQRKTQDNSFKLLSFLTLSLWLQQLKTA